MDSKRIVLKIEGIQPRRVRTRPFGEAMVTLTANKAWPAILIFIGGTGRRHKRMGHILQIWIPIEFLRQPKDLEITVRIQRDGTELPLNITVFDPWLVAIFRPLVKKLTSRATRPKT